MIPKTLNYRPNKGRVVVHPFRSNFVRPSCSFPLQTSLMNETSPAGGGGLVGSFSQFLHIPFRVHDFRFGFVRFGKEIRSLERERVMERREKKSVNQ